MSSTERSRILAQIRGQTVRIPDLRDLFSGWPQDSSDHEASIIPVIGKILDSDAYDISIAAKLRQENLAMLISRWWPDADLEILLELAQFVGCIFTVDGLIDQVSGPGREKNEVFLALYRATDTFAAQGHDPSSHAKMLVSSNPAINSFRGLVELLAKRYTSEQCKMFLAEARCTMEMLSVQQKFRISGKIPSLEEYQTYRMGSCCINAIIALVEYGNHLSIPDKVMNGSEMISLKREAVCVNWMTNDILSVKKELASGFVENLVVLCASDRNAQTGVDNALALLRSSVDRFEAAAVRVTSHYAGNEALSRDIDKFAQGCRCICMGSYTWSLASKRYGLEEIKRDATGGIVFTL